MKTTYLLAGAAILSLATAPAFAQTSGNGGNLLGANGGNHRSSSLMGATNQNGALSNNTANNNSGSKSTSSNRASRNSGSNWHDNSYNVRDTSVGGVGANPMVDTGRSSNNNGNNGGGNSSYVSASAPVGFDGVTVGGASANRSGGSAHDNSRSSSNNHMTSHNNSASRASNASGGNSAHGSASGNR